MPPKKNISLEEGDELRKSLEFLTEEVANIRKDQKKILELMEEVKKLRNENKEKGKMIENLEKRVDELEQYTRINDVVITGLKIRPRTYANAVAADNNGGEPSGEEVRSAEQQVANFLHSKGINLNVEDLEDCHPLPRRRKEETPAIILRFTNRKKKIALLK